MTDTMVREMLLDADLPADESDELVGFLTSLRDSAESEQPMPDARLAALFASTAVDGNPDALDEPETDTSVVRLRRRDGRLASAAAALAISTVAATGVAAAANELPAPAQLVVSHFSQHFLPFEFPAPPPLSPSPDDSGAGQPAAPAGTREPIPVQEQPAVDPERPQGLSQQIVQPSVSDDPSIASPSTSPTGPQTSASGTPATPTATASGTASASPSGSPKDDPSGDTTSSPSDSPSAESPEPSPTGTPPVVRGGGSPSPSTTASPTLTTEGPSPTSAP
ncbi:MAG TPA: hypothetical protein VFJ19_19165 [Nocardioidaceae bacterium]|nr:hypothetical protein [Nocardioidaceae bacterium]